MTAKRGAGEERDKHLKKEKKKNPKKLQTKTCAGCVRDVSPASLL